MNATKIISFILAIMAAVLIAMAGKSCAKDIAQKNSERHQNNTKATPSFNLVTDPRNGGSTGEIPHLIEDESSAVGEDGSAEATTEREYVTVTNIFGEVVESIPVTTPEEALIPTTTLSILDAYNQEHSTEEETTDPPVEHGTVKTDIVIEINP